MEHTCKIESVTERDIDLLLLEEFNVSQDFSSWFYSTVSGKSDNPYCNGAWHSVRDSILGESDLIVLYSNGVAVLIENKIDAIAQPEQGNRYKARGEKGVSEGTWKEFVICMVAPKLYLRKERDAQAYDKTISYEDFTDWLSSYADSSNRATYKAFIFKEAIEQNRRGYSIIPDQTVSTFWLNYWEVSSGSFPELQMKKPGLKPANSDWPDFRPSIFGNNLVIVHKLARGVVDLQISGAADRIPYFKDLISDQNVEVSKAGKSAAIRIEVPPIDRFSSFESQKDNAMDGMKAASLLLSIGRKLINEI